MKVNKKRIIAGILSVSMSISCIILNNNEILSQNTFKTISVNAASQTYSNNGVNYTYETSNNKITITKITLDSNISSNTTIVIPSTINGVSVSTIGSNAFQSSAKIGTLKLPMSLEYIQDSAFKACTNMNTVYVPKTIKGVAGSAFGPNTKVTTLYIRNSESSSKKIQNGTDIKNLISNVIVKCNGQLDQFITCTSNGTATKYGMLDLIDSLAYSPFLENIYSSYATEIVNSIIPANTSDIEKMQIIYNYVLSTVRYSKIFSGTNDASNCLNNTHQKALGALMCYSGVCASEADTIYYLGKAAGLDVKTLSVPGHRLNLFSPSDTTLYYYVDITANTFCSGYSLYGSDSELSKTEVTARDGSICQIASNYYGKTILVQIKNNENTNFNISLTDANNSSKNFCDYLATSPTSDYTPMYLSNLPLNNNREFYLYDNKYYNLKISQNSTTVFSLNYALNKGDNYSTTFTDVNNNQHTCNIKIVRDNNDNKTINKARFVINID